jgi:transcriptional regulator with XRE-family HTH domain
MSQKEKESVGVRILKVRGEMGVAEFADELGVNRKTITRWEANEALPDGASLLALMQKFGVDPAWILTGSGAAPDLAPDEATLLANYRHCPPDGKTAIRATSAALAAGTVAPRKKIKQIEGSIQNFHSQVDQVAGRDVVNQGRRKK